jgi:hypothetical protein
VSESKPSAVGIFLSSVQRAQDNTGHKPTRNVISKALFDRIVDETLITMAVTDPLPIGPQKGCGQLLGYPVRIIDSPHLFALSFDPEEPL